MRSKTLTDYLNRQKLPQILCGIERKTKEQLQEAIDLSTTDHFPLMLPKKDDFPTSKGYTYRSHGVWISKDLSHIMYKSAKKEVKMRPEEFERMNALAQETGNAFHDEVSKIQKKLAPEYGMYDKSHINIIHAYQGDSMGNINKKLTQGKVRTEDRERMVSLDEAVHLHQTPDSMVVYSGISSEHAHKVILHDKVHHPAYLSTSLSPHVAAAFASFKSDEDQTGAGRGGRIQGHMLKIVVPKHHHGAFVGHLNEMNEAELILPRDTVLNIHRDKTLYAPIPHSDGTSFYTIHHATIEKK